MKQVKLKRRWRGRFLLKKSEAVLRMYIVENQSSELRWRKYLGGPEVKAVQVSSVTCLRTDQNIQKYKSK